MIFPKGRLSFVAIHFRLSIILKEFQADMRILRFDSVGGASGDMILGALVQLGVDLQIVEREIHELIPNEVFSFQIDEKSSFGVSGIHLQVNLGGEHEHSREHEHEHGRDRKHECEHVCKHENECSHEHEHDGARPHVHGRTWAEIRLLLERSSLDEKTKNDSLAAFSALAEAEAEVHGVAVDNVHFHEVGAVDSIVDTIGCALGLNLLKIDGVSLSPLPIGEGTFRCAHGVYPIPAPAVANLLRKYALPISYDVEPFEMLTPTATSLFAVWNKVSIPDGAKLIATANSFGTHEMKNRPNLLRVSLFETEDALEGELYASETLCELETNVDDATGERLASAAATLFEAGALDVWFEPIQMKKGRPASRFCVLVRERDRAAAVDLIIRHTGVFGVRETIKRRYSLARYFKTIETPYGPARVKIGTTKAGEIVSVAPEYEDCAALASASGQPFETVYREILRRYAEN